MSKFKLKGTIVRAKTRDVAFGFRMGTGFPGDVNRTGMFSIVPCLTNVANPPTAYGDPVLVDAATNSVRKVLDTDDAIVTVYGAVVRPFPSQQGSGGMSASLGAATPPATGVVDIIRDGFFMAKVVGTPAKDGAVFIWTAPPSGAHVTGGYEAVATGGSTAAVTNVTFNGPPGADGVCELYIRSK